MFLCQNTEEENGYSSEDIQLLLNIDVVICWFQVLDLSAELDGVAVEGRHGHLLHSFEAGLAVPVQGLRMLDLACESPTYNLVMVLVGEFVILLVSSAYSISMMRNLRLGCII